MRPGRQRGFSLLELIVVIVLISCLFTLAIDRLLVLQVSAERAAMESVLGSLRSALTISVAENVAKGRTAELARLVDSNPMQRLSEIPENYRGELFGPDPAALAPGSWYFDTRDRVLVYLPRSAEQFTTDQPGLPRARFAVQPVFDDKNGNGRFDAGTDELRGVRLASLNGYVWR